MGLFSSVQFTENVNGKMVSIITRYTYMLILAIYPNMSYQNKYESTTGC